MKFKYIPNWGTYVAQEHNGKWYTYEYRPNYNQGSWIYEGRREEIYIDVESTLGPVKGKTEWDI